MAKGATGGEDVIWPAEPHTLAKHQVYRQYLSKWMPIMIHSWRGDVTYAEGFSGPGVYTGGEPGSPVIALETLIKDPTLRTRARDLRFLFVEGNLKRAERLREQLEKAAKPVPLSELARYGIDLAVEPGDYDPALTELLTAHNAWGRPMLVVLDTFGGSVKLDLVRRIARNPSSEVIITFEPQYFVRWAKTDKIRHGDTVFGDPDWRRVDEQPQSAKAQWVVDKYRAVLQDVGFPFVLTFELVNTRGHSLFLVFGTTHVRGLQKMKEAMWEVDPIYGVQYRDPADPNQQLLDVTLDPLTEPLRRELLLYLRNQPEHTASVGDLRRFALYRTVYKESQVKPELDKLVDKKLAIGDGADGHVRLGGNVRLTKAGLNSGG
ncbi:three-Cys-motif partner protein TcmP [Georgenia daeguensis]|uniref:Three-Cys-motif partner protein TcmP n=1 Tax=Georgenia daeguensis TaxID=908355 RepID=A0ABP6UMB3_9MICO